MKILFVIDSLGMGGKERRLLELLKGLKGREEISFQLAVLSDQVFYTYVEELNVITHFLVRRVKRDLSVLIKLYRICRKYQPDVIHSWESMCSVYALPVAKMSGVKFVNGMITNAPSKVKRFGKSWFRAALTFPFSDTVISNSHAGLKSYKAPMHKSVCIHNGFDLSRLEGVDNPERVKKRLNIGGEKVVAMVASFSPRKDFESYIRSALRLCVKREDVVFLAIGDGSTLNRCREIAAPHFSERVRFVSRQKDIESIVNILDIGVLLTNHRVHGEGISNSVLEYMAFGKPVIATDGGGTGEVVADGKTGFLVSPFDVEEISKRVEFLLDHGDVAREMGRAGKEKLVREFGLDKMTDAYIRLYGECLVPS